MRLILLNTSVNNWGNQAGENITVETASVVIAMARERGIQSLSFLGHQGAVDYLNTLCNAQASLCRNKYLPQEGDVIIALISNPDVSRAPQGTEYTVEQMVENKMFSLAIRRNLHMATYQDTSGDIARHYLIQDDFFTPVVAPKGTVNYDL